MDKNLPKRKAMRLKNFDYSSTGAYFITICTHNRKCMLSQIVGAIHESPETVLTEYGKIVDEIIKNVSERCEVTIDRYIIMPNHVHLLVIITDSEELRAIRESPLRGRSVISKAIGYIKMNASKEIHTRFGKINLWQRGFYDHIIRGKEDYEEHLKYIAENPMRWYYDELYTDE